MKLQTYGESSLQIPLPMYVNGGGAWSNQPQQQQQQQYQQQQHHQQQQHQHHQQQQHQQQQKGGKQAQAQAGAAGRMDPRHAAANAAAMAMQGHLQQVRISVRTHSCSPMFTLIATNFWTDLFSPSGRCRRARDTSRCWRSS